MVRASDTLTLVAAALLATAVVMIHSAGTTAHQAPLTAAGILTSRHAMFAVMALIAMTFAGQLNIRRAAALPIWSNPITLALLASMALVAILLVPGIGKSVNGATRWLSVGPITFQPSELLKWALVPAICLWCARRHPLMGKLFTSFLPAIVVVGLACFLVVVEDLGTAALMGAVAICLLSAGGAHPLHIVGVMAPAGAMGYLAVAGTPYRIERLKAWWDPWADASASGYHPIQSLLAIAEGGVTGRGLGNGIQKFGYLPEDTTDFIFAIICEELGLAGAILVVALYLGLLIAGWRVFTRCPDAFGRLLALGILLTFCGQAIFNLAVVTVLVPAKGIALPLLSAGGTGWIVTCFALGLLISLDRGNHAAEAAVLDERQPAPPVAHATASPQ